MSLLCSGRIVVWPKVKLLYLGPGDDIYTCHPPYRTMVLPSALNIIVYVNDYFTRT